MFDIFFRRKKRVVLTPDLHACAGKHPVYVEFIQHGEPYEIASFYTELFKQSYTPDFHQHLKLQEKFICHDFMVYEPNKPLICGVLTINKDASGRTYPFVILRKTEQPVAIEFSFSLPCLYQQFFSNARSLLTLAKVVDVEDLSQQVLALGQYNQALDRVDVLDDLMRLLKQPTFFSFMLSLQSLLNVSDIATLTTVLHYFISQTKLLVTKEGGVVRIPLVENMETKTQVIFWLKLLEGVCQLEGKPLSIYWSDQPNSSAIYVFCGRPNPNHIHNVNSFLLPLSLLCMEQVAMRGLEPSELPPITIESHDSMLVGLDRLSRHFG